MSKYEAENGTVLEVGATANTVIETGLSFKNARLLAAALNSGASPATIEASGEMLAALKDLKGEWDDYSMDPYDRESPSLLHDGEINGLILKAEGKK